MITLITGVPGAGKTASAVSLGLRQNKPLVAVNLRSSKINTVTLDEVSSLTNTCVIVDECQKFFPHGEKSQLQYFLETHRHHGLDFILTTQGAMSIPRWLRPLIGKHIHLTEASLKDRRFLEWPRIANPLSSVDVRAAEKRFENLPKDIFDYYETVEEGAEIPKIARRKIPKIYFVLCVIPLVAFAAQYYAIPKEETEPEKQVEQEIVAPIPLPRSEKSWDEIYKSAKLREATSTEKILPDNVVGCVKVENTCRCYDESARVVNNECPPHFTNKY